MLYGAEMWGLEEGWTENDKPPGRFCKKILQMPRFVAKGMAELETRRGIRRGKVMNRREN